MNRHASNENRSNVPPADAADITPPHGVRELEGGVLCFDIFGPMTFDGMVAIGAEILAVCAERGCTKALADARGQSGDLPIFEWHKLATTFEHTWTRAVRLAIVDRADRIKPDRFLESTARNRGIDVLVFDDPDKALAWLNA